MDDQLQFRQATARLLEHAGHEAIQAADGSEGLHVFLVQRPDLVITDLFMPGTDGLEFLRSLARAHTGVKVIAVSGGAFMHAPSILAVARTLGAVRTMSKPVEPAALLAAVDELLAGNV